MRNVRKELFAKLLYLGRVRPLGVHHVTLQWFTLTGRNGKMELLNIFFFETIIQIKLNYVPK